MQVVLEIWRRVWIFIGLRLRRSVLWWVKPRVSPQDVVESLGLDPDRPVCYLLGTSSLADYVVLENACRRVKMPARSSPSVACHAANVPPPCSCPVVMSAMSAIWSA